MPLSPSQRRERAAFIRDAAASAGLREGWLLAGIAQAETQLAQCQSELPWSCPGPYSPECRGPVVAGAADGPCSIEQGGLSLFQFDAGTYSQTLAKYGSGILTTSGATAQAIEYVVAMVLRSAYVPQARTRADALRWLNSIRPGTPAFDAWIQTVTRYYNGCQPSSSCWAARNASYRAAALQVHSEFGAGFWHQPSELSVAVAVVVGGALGFWLTSRLL